MYGARQCCQLTFLNVVFSALMSVDGVDRRRGRADSRHARTAVWSVCVVPLHSRSDTATFPSSNPSNSKAEQIEQSGRYE